MKVPMIKDVRTFLTIAHINGYYFKDKYCYKNIVYGEDCIIEIKINLVNGYISFKTYWNNVSCQLERVDKEYLLKEIDCLIKWVDIECIN